MKRMSASLLRHILIVVLAASLCLGVGCDLERILKVLFTTCLKHGFDGADCWCELIPQLDEYNGIPCDDPIPGGPEEGKTFRIVDPCGSTFMKVWAAGQADGNATFWVALERNGEQLSYSQEVNLDDGVFAGVAMMIPLDGLDLDTREYSISAYYSPAGTSGGNPKTSIGRELDIARVQLEEETVRFIRSKTRRDHTALYDDMNCMMVGDTVGFTITRGNGLEIVPGMNYDSSVVWSTGGRHCCDLDMIQPAVFVARYEALNNGDAYVVATDTVNDLADTMGVIISGTGSVACGPVTNSQVKAVTQPITNTLAAAKASIKARFGRLCGDPTDGLTPFSLVTVSLADTTIQSHGYMAWVETGLANVRLNNGYGIGALYHCRYAELQGSLPDHDYIFDITRDVSPWIVEGDIYDVEVRIDANTAVASAVFCGDEWFLFDSDPVWNGNLGNQVQWKAEVLHAESDMSGTVSDPCFLTDCATRTDGGQFVAYNLLQTQYGSHDPNEWWFRITQDTLYVWDVVPIP